MPYKQFRGNGLVSEMDIVGPKDVVFLRDYFSEYRQSFAGCYGVGDYTRI